MTSSGSQAPSSLHGLVAARLRFFGTLGLSVICLGFSIVRLSQFWADESRRMETREAELRATLSGVLQPAERALSQTIARGRDIERALEAYVKSNPAHLWAEFRMREGKNGQEAVRAYRDGQRVKTRGWGPSTRKKFKAKARTRSSLAKDGEESRQVSYRGLEWKNGMLEVRAAIEQVHFGLIREAEWVFKVKLADLARDFPLFDEVIALPDGTGVLLSGRALPVKRANVEIFEQLKRATVLSGDLTYGLLIRWEAVLWEAVLTVAPTFGVFFGLWVLLWASSFSLAKRFGVGVHHEEDLVLTPEEQDALRELLKQSGSEIVALAQAHEKVAYSVTDLFRVMGPGTAVVASDRTPRDTFSELQVALKDLKSLSKPWEALSRLAKEWKEAAMTATPEQLQMWASQMETLAVRADALTKDAQTRVERGFAELEGFFERGFEGSPRSGEGPAQGLLRPMVTQSQKLLKVAQESHRKLSHTHRTLQERLLQKRSGSELSLEDRSASKRAA